MVLRAGALAAVVLSLLVAPAAHAAAAPADFIGTVSDDVFAGDAAYRADQLQRQSNAGIGLERYPFAWNTIEKSPGQYDLSYHDAYVGDLARRGMTVLPVLLYSPTFRSSAPAGDPNPTAYMPKNPADMGAFAAVLVRRYGPAGTYWTEHPDVPKRPITAWQVWNEPNITSYSPTGPDAARYTQLLKETGKAIKAADPSAKVIAAGLTVGTSGTPMLRYLDEMYEAGAAGSYDALAIHAYAADDQAVLKRVEDFRADMTAHGDSKDLWITEVGWGSSGSVSDLNTDEAGQAARLGCAVARLGEARDRLHIGKVVQYDWKDDRPASSSGHFSLYSGLLRSDGTAKPSLGTFSQSALKATGRAGGASSPPVACIDSQASSVVGERVPFKSASTDAPDGTIASQAWDLDDDGSFDDGTASGAAWTFWTAGSHRVRVRVTDNSGGSQIATKTITVGPKAQVSGSTLLYRAGSGETNDATVSGSGGTYTLRDAGAAVRPGPGCTAVDANTVRCTSVSSLNLDLGDGNDSATNQTTLAATIDGGAGNDTLTGGAGKETFPQGATPDGSDTLAGGGGVDTVTYADRTKPIRVSLNDVRDDGDSGELDDVRGDVENVTGGWAGDVLVGSSAANALIGGWGKDTLDGGAGDDSFSQPSYNDGADSVAGGAGVDSVTYTGRKLGVRVSLDGVANDGTDADADGTAEEGDNIKGDVQNVNGGLGADWLQGSATDNTLVGYKANDTLLGGDGNDRLDGQSGADTISGEGGTDRALYASRTASVWVDIDGVADDGNSDDGPTGGTRDNVETDVEDLTGGSSDDDLTGSDGPNSIDGGKGVDSLRGKGGDDALTALDGVTDRQVLCGLGTDSVRADAADPVIRTTDEGCESVTRG